MHIIINDKNFCLLLVVIVYSEAGFSIIISVHILLFSEPDGILVSNKFHIKKHTPVANWLDWGDFEGTIRVLQISYTTRDSMSLHKSNASKSYCCRCLVLNMSPRTMYNCSSMSSVCGFFLW